MDAAIGAAGFGVVAAGAERSNKSPMLLLDGGGGLLVVGKVAVLKSPKSPPKLVFRVVGIAGVMVAAGLGAGLVSKNPPPLSGACFGGIDG